ncbi:MAG: hypothetical protein IID61_09370 [SAR324 cluster bacterium]|nr:hypothetical protein [SAR324 cluster bacterium]
MNTLQGSPEQIAEAESLLERHRDLIGQVIAMLRHDATTSSHAVEAAGATIVGFEDLRDTGVSEDVIATAKFGSPGIERLQDGYNLNSAIVYQYLAMAFKAMAPVVRRFPKGFDPNPEEWRRVEDNLFERVRRRFPAGFEPNPAEWRYVRDNLYEKIR